MRITFVMAGGFNMSGGDRVISIYAERLMRRGHDVTVVARPVAPVRLMDQLKSLKRHRRLIKRGPGFGPSHFDGSPVPHRRLESYRPVVDADVPDADVVIATWWETAPWVERLSPSKGAKAYFIQHYEVFEHVPKEGVDATWRLPSLHKITISKWLVELAHKFGDDKVSLVLNSVDMDQFDAPPRGKQDVPTIGLLNHTVQWKGIPISIEAIRQALPQVPRIRLRSFGEAPFKAELPDGVELEYFQHPAQDSIRDIYAGCDVWLCGSYAEGFHLPPLEAMACRCPVVSTEVGGPADIIQPGVNGFLAPVGDSAALARHLVTVLTKDEAEWKRMSDAAYATATGYSWDDATDLFEAALVKAIERGKIAA